MGTMKARVGIRITTITPLIQRSIVRTLRMAATASVPPVDTCIGNRSQWTARSARSSASNTLGVYMTKRTHTSQV